MINRFVLRIGRYVGVGQVEVTKSGDLPNDALDRVGACSPLNPPTPPTPTLGTTTITISNITVITAAGL